MGTNNYISKLKARLDQAIFQRDHWKQLAENRNSILVTEVCPDLQRREMLEEYIVGADNVRALWRLALRYLTGSRILFVRQSKPGHIHSCDYRGGYDSHYS